MSRLSVELFRDHHYQDAAEECKRFFEMAKMNKEAAKMAGAQAAKEALKRAERRRQREQRSLAAKAGKEAAERASAKATKRLVGQAAREAAKVAASRACLPLHHTNAPTYGKSPAVAMVAAVWMSKTKRASNRGGLKKRKQKASAKGAFGVGFPHCDRVLILILLLVLSVLSGSITTNSSKNSNGRTVFVHMETSIGAADGNSDAIGSTGTTEAGDDPGEVPASSEPFSAIGDPVQMDTSILLRTLLPSSFSAYCFFAQLLLSAAYVSHATTVTPRKCKGKSVRPGKGCGGAP